MLKNSSVAAVSLLASKLADSKVFIEPHPSTPLAAAVNACYSPAVDIQKTSEGTPEDIVYQIANDSRNPGLNDIAPHDAAMEDIVRVLSKSIQNSLMTARNVVKPIISAVVADVEKVRQASTVKMALVMSVAPDTYEDIWSSAVLEDMVDKYRNAPVMSDAVVPNIHPLITNEQMIDLLKTGSSRFDKEVMEWVEEIGPEFVFDTYRNYFAVRSDDFPAPDDNATQIQYLTGTSPVERRRTLIIHLMARRLKQDVLEGIDYDLNDYAALMAAVIEQSGRGIVRVLDARERDRKQRRLVTNWPMPNAEYQTANPELAVISVNNDVYDLWLKEGGCPEILFGSSITDREQGYSALLEKAEDYVMAWNRRAATIRSGQRSDMFNITLGALRDSVTRQINELAEDQLLNKTRAPLHDKLREELSEITLNDVKDIWKCAKHIVCEVMFSHTDSRKILDTIDNIGAENPDMEPREVALLATIDILVRWMSDQFIITHEN